jgi:hypothetical protein
MEMGIRKVLGASVISITGELLKEFVKPVLIAAVAATPITWYRMNKWLQDFAYRINIQLGDFYCSRSIRIIDCCTYNMYPINKSSNGKSSEDFENRMKV